MYQLEGTVKLVNAVQTFQSGFTKREFVVTTDEQYPQDIKFECVKEKCALLDSVSQGQRVNVSFRIRGNEYKERYFVNLQAFKVDSQGAGTGGRASGGTGASAGGAAADAFLGEEPAGASGDGVNDDPFADESSPF